MSVETWLPIALAILVLSFLEWRRWKARGRPPGGGTAPARPTPVQLSAEPDVPRSFGYKSLWLALGSTDPGAVAAALHLDHVRPANWKTGLGAASSGLVFVSPPVEGWVLVVGQGLPNLGSPESAETWAELMERAAEASDDVQYFATHRVVEYHAWARHRRGRRPRSFAYLGESGEILADEGEPTPEELAVGVPEVADPEAWLPDEETVLAVAGRWSLDPRQLGERPPSPGVGLVGQA